MIKINNFELSKNSPTFLIAEGCENHLGSLDLAFEMIDKAKISGANAIKFQHHLPDDEMLKDVPKSKNFGQSSLYNFLKENSLKRADHIKLKQYCDKKNILYLCTPFSFSAALEINDLVPLFKIGSGEMLDFPTLEKIAKFNKPMIVSTGMSTKSEITETYNFLKNKTNLVLMNCLSEYPPKYEDLNLSFIKEMITSYPDALIGHSDHTSDIYSSIVAVSFGAKIIEKHVIIDKSVKCPDQEVSIDFNQLTELVNSIRKIEVSLGSNKLVHENEKIIRSWAHRSIVTIKKIEKNEKITEKNISTKRPGIGIPARNFKKIIGKTSTKMIDKDSLLKKDDFK